MQQDTLAPEARLREFWDNHVAKWKIARSPVGTQAFFSEVEQYRFEKLSYLPTLVPYDGFPGKTVLEVGCGLANDLVQFAKNGSLTTGVDISPVAIDLATENFRQRGLSCSHHVMNGESLDFEAETFDVVYCHTVLQFTPNPARMCDEIWRVLKPGGTAYLMVINKLSWLLFLHRLFNIEIDHLDAPYYHTHSVSELRDLTGRFSKTTIHRERYPVATKVHKGALASVFNYTFVPLWNALPAFSKEWCAHHLFCIAEK